MKKTLLAMAVLAASGASFAQSSVTLYGVADLAIAKTTGSSAEMVGANAANNGTSRFGLRGTEDLGGGLKAGFNFEAGINAEDGSQANEKLFARAANVTLGGNFGEIRLGRSLSLGFHSVAAYELTGTANYSIIGSTFGYANGTRNDSEIRYTSPNMGGFQAGIGYIMKPDNGGKAKLDLGATYKNGPISAGVAYTKTQDAEKSWLIGGGYDFGVAKVAGGYYDPIGASKGFSLGVSAPFGPVTATLDVARDTGLKATNFLVEGKYALSKRTFTYVAVQRFNTAKVTTTSVGVRHNF